MSAFATFDIRENFLLHWESSLEQFGLKLNQGSGRQHLPNVRKGSDRLFHITTSDNIQLLWLQVRLPQRNALDGIDHSLLSYMIVPHQTDGLNARRRLAGDQLESLLLGSGAKMVKQVIFDQFIANCSSAFFEGLPTLLASFQSFEIKISMRKKEDLLEPFATIHHGSDAIMLFAGRMIERQQGFTCYVRLTPQKSLIGKKRLNARANELLTQICLGHDSTQVRRIAGKELFAPVQRF